MIPVLIVASLSLILDANTRVKIAGVGGGVRPPWSSGRPPLEKFQIRAGGVDFLPSLTPQPN